MRKAEEVREVRKMLSEMGREVGEVRLLLLRIREELYSLQQYNRGRFLPSDAIGEAEEDLDELMRQAKRLHDDLHYLERWVVEMHEES